MLSKTSDQSLDSKSMIRILLVVRKGKGADGMEHPVRYFSNLDAIIAMIKVLPGVELITQDFSEISFEAQVRGRIATR